MPGDDALSAEELARVRRFLSEFGDSAPQSQSAGAGGEREAGGRGDGRGEGDGEARRGQAEDPRAEETPEQRLERLQEEDRVARQGGASALYRAAVADYDPSLRGERSQPAEHWHLADSDFERYGRL